MQKRFVLELHAEWSKLAAGHTWSATTETLSGRECNLVPTVDWFASGVLTLSSRLMRVCGRC